MRVVGLLLATAVELLTVVLEAESEPGIAEVDAVDDPAVRVHDLDLRVRAGEPGVDDAQPEPGLAGRLGQRLGERDQLARLDDAGEALERTEARRQLGDGSQPGVGERVQGGKGHRAGQVSRQVERRA